MKSTIKVNTPKLKNIKQELKIYTMRYVLLKILNDYMMKIQHIMKKDFKENKILPTIDKLIHDIHEYDRELLIKNLKEYLDFLFKDEPIYERDNKMYKEYCIPKDVIFNSLKIPTEIDNEYKIINNYIYKIYVDNGK